jgi:hypothetical protein
MPLQFPALDLKESMSATITGETDWDRLIKFSGRTIAGLLPCLARKNADISREPGMLLA